MTLGLRSIFALALCLSVAPLVASCSGGGASYPDAGDVTAAQGAWCDALAKLNGGKWEHLAACKGAYPASSAPYLRAMTKCFVDRMTSAGDKAPDKGQVVAECNDQITINMKVDDSAGAEAIEARCDRMHRCEKVAINECKAAFAKLESALRAVLIASYNRSALHEISDCLISSSCAADEDAGREACYKKVQGRLVWFP